MAFRPHLLVLSLVLVAPVAGRAEAQRPDGYLVAPFENGSGVRALDWMASALATTVAEKMEAIPSLRPAYGNAILEALPARFDEAKLAARARRVDARWVVGGSFGRPNWKAEIKIRMYEVTPIEPPILKQVASAQAIGERSALVDLVDQVLLDLLRQSQLLPEGEQLAALRRRPTKDLYAYTLFGRALNLYYGFSEPADHPAAIRVLQKAISIDPKFAEAHRVLGLLYLSRGDHGRAAGQYSYALDLRPGYYSALAGLAHIYRADNRRQPAIDLATRAIEARPFDTEMRFLLGELEWEGGELDKALADLLQVTEVQPRHVAARRTLALVYAARGNVVELAEELERIAELAPDDLEVKLDLGSAYMRLGRNENALAAYEAVLRKQPKNIQALKFTGDLYRRVHEFERAIAAYEKVRHLVPDDPRPYFLLGAAYAEAGNDVKAEQILQDAQEFRHHLGEAWTDLGAIALRRGDLSKANWYLQRAVERAPMRPKAHYNYALVLNATKQRDKALSELRTAAQLDPEDATCLYLAGVINLRLGRLDDAKIAFLEALKRRPAYADAKHNLQLLEELEKRYGSERSGTGSQ